MLILIAADNVESNRRLRCFDLLAKAWRTRVQATPLRAELSEQCLQASVAPARTWCRSYPC